MLFSSGGSLRNLINYFHIVNFITSYNKLQANSQFFSTKLKICKVKNSNFQGLIHCSIFFPYFFLSGLSMNTKKWS